LHVNPVCVFWEQPLVRFCGTECRRACYYTLCDGICRYHSNRCLSAWYLTSSALEPIRECYSSALRRHSRCTFELLSPPDHANFRLPRNPVASKVCMHECSPSSSLMIVTKRAFCCSSTSILSSLATDPCLGTVHPPPFRGCHAFGPFRLPISAYLQTSCTAR
jgi:hypothetical protein